MNFIKLCFLIGLFLTTTIVFTQTDDLNEEVFKVAEIMPMFPGCPSELNTVQLKECARSRMLSFIYQNVQYPQKAIDLGVQGTVVIRFIVDTDGSILNPEIVRTVGAGTGEEALRVIKLFPKWNPGRNEGEPVKVQFNVPIKFKLDKKTIKALKKKKRKSKT